MPAFSSTTSARSSAPRRTRLLTLLIALSTAQQAHALANETPRPFHIGRAPLEHVLLEIARVSGQHVSFASNLVQERWAGPIDGTMSAREAAGRALQGSGLTLASLPDGTLTVVAADVSAPPLNVGTLAATEVHGSTDDGFAVFSTGGITRVETAMSNMPHAIDTVSSGLLASRQPPSLADAVNQVGVVPVVVDQAAPPQYAIRGFMTDTISVDGLPDRIASMRPLEALDEIAVIKGPNADVAGVTMAGGTISASLKTPGIVPERSIAVEAGSHAERKVIADLGGAIGTNGLTYRVIGVQDSSANSDAGYIGHRVSYGHAALGWSDSATEVTVGVESLASRQPVQPATFALNGAPVRLASESPLGNTDDDVRGHAERFYYKLSHNLTDDWAVHSRWSYENVRLQSAQWHLVPTADGSVPMPTVGMGYRSDNRVWALSNDLAGTVRQGPLTHSLVLGWDEIQDRLDFHYPGAVDLGLQNPYAPVPLPATAFVPRPVAVADGAAVGVPAARPYRHRRALGDLRLDPGKRLHRQAAACQAAGAGLDTGTRRGLQAGRADFVVRRLLARFPDQHRLLLQRRDHAAGAQPTAGNRPALGRPATQADGSGCAVPHHGQPRGRRRYLAPRLLHRDPGTEQRRDRTVAAGFARARLGDLAVGHRGAHQARAAGQSVVHGARYGRVHVDHVYGAGRHAGRRGRGGRCHCPALDSVLRRHGVPRARLRPGGRQPVLAPQAMAYRPACAQSLQRAGVRQHRLEQLHSHPPRPHADAAGDPPLLSPRPPCLACRRIRRG